MKRILPVVIALALIVILVLYYNNRFEYGGVYNPLEYDGNGLTNIKKMLEVQKDDPDTMSQTIYKIMDSPDQVVKLYNMLIMGIYNDELNQEDKETLVELQRRLFDDEFKDENPVDVQIEKVIEEAKALNAKGFAILGSNSNPFMTFGEKSEYASIESIIYTNVKEPYDKIYREYLLQLDAEKKWRVKGFRKIDEVILVGE